MSKAVSFSIAVVLAAIVAGPALADCASEMKKTDDMMMKSSDAKKKEMAMKEMAMAKDMMAKKDEKGCMEHTGKAMKNMK